MRTNLATDPKVIRLVQLLARDGVRITCHENVTDVTNVTRLVVIGALHSIWSVACEHAREGVLSSLLLSDLDSVVGISGFGKALGVVGWAEEVDGGVKLPNAEEFNVLAANRMTSSRAEGGEEKPVSAAAMRKRAERERKRAERDGVTPSVTGHATSHGAGHAPDVTSHATPIELNKDLEKIPPFPPETRGVTGHTQNTTSHAVTPTQEAQIAKALIECGIMIQSCDPHVVSWVQAGLSVPHVLKALNIARDSQPDNRIKSGYLNKIITNPRNGILDGTVKLRLSDPFLVTAYMQAWASSERLSVDLDLETKKFISNAKSQARTSADWLAEWQKWILNAEGYARERRSKCSHDIEIANAITDVNDISWAGYGRGRSGAVGRNGVSGEPGIRDVAGEVRKSVPAHLSNAGRNKPSQEGVGHGDFDVEQFPVEAGDGFDEIGVY